MSESATPRTEDAHDPMSARLSLALQAAEMGVIEVDATWSQITLDQQARQLFAVANKTEDATLGKLIQEKMNADDLERIQTSCFLALTNGETVNQTFRIQTTEGSVRFLQLRANPVPGPAAGDGGKRLIGIIRNVTEHMAHEEALATTAREKALLFDELEHRVRNVLQMVTSLLNLQAARSSNEETRAALSDAASRVVAIAAAYRRLARTDHGSLVEIAPALAEIANAVRTAAGSPPHIQQTVDIHHLVARGSTVMHLGLLVSELLTNAYKHAFKGRKTGMLHLSGHKAGSDILIEIRDDGIGDAAAHDNGLGNLLVSAFAATINARLEKLPSAEGTYHRITVPMAEAT